MGCDSPCSSHRRREVGVDESPLHPPPKKQWLSFRLSWRACPGGVRPRAPDHAVWRVRLLLDGRCCLSATPDTVANFDALRFACSRSVDFRRCKRYRKLPQPLPGGSNTVSGKSSPSHPRRPPVLCGRYCTARHSVPPAHKKTVGLVSLFLAKTNLRSPLSRPQGALQCLRARWLMRPAAE